MGLYAESSTTFAPVFRRACGLCSLSEFCWPPELSVYDLNRLHLIVRRTGSLPAGHHLYRTHDRFTAVYAVRTGCIKTYSADFSGDEHVHGFHLPGELLGFDAVYPERHRLNAMIIQDSALCIVPYHNIAELSRDYPRLQQRIMALMSSEFMRQRAFVDGSDATRRTAMFLLDIEHRLRRHKDIEYDFLLPMSREDIANFLGIKAETLSRVISRLQQANLINASRRRIRLLDVAKLDRIAQGMSQCSKAALN